MRDQAVRTAVTRSLPRLAFALACWAVCGPALADPGYYVVTAYDNAGQRSVDLRYWTVKFPQMPEVAWPELGVGYGVTSRWTTELYASWIGSSQFATRLSTLNWQNDVLLTQGEWPLDVAVHTNLISNRMPSGGGAIEWGPVLQTDVGRTQLNGNVFLENGWDGFAPAAAQMKYQWQIRHRWRPLLHFGFQGFGELGRWDHWSPRDQQSHRAGPALFSNIALGDRQSLQVQAAYLFGSIYGQDGRMFTMRAQLVF